MKYLREDPVLREAHDIAIHKSPNSDFSDSEVADVIIPVYTLVTHNPFLLPPD